MVATELLSLLTRQAGREYHATLTHRRTSPATKPVTRRQGKGHGQDVTPPTAPQPYRFTVRGDQIEATGPSGQTRMLSPERFLALFSAAHFTDVLPTGRLSDLGPLFALS